VIGMGQAAAVEKLEGAGLEADLADRAYSETVPTGRVIQTDPPAGDRILDGGTVTVVVSLGKERYDVPDLRGKSEDHAQDALSKNHLEFGKSVGKYSENVPKGRVIGTDPKAGTTLKPNTIVDLFVSKGPHPIKIRDWTGKEADRAQEVMERKGLKVDRDQQEYSDDVPEGYVISQSPSDGTLFRGETVTLVVSQGPELVEVPDGLVASGVEDARQRLLDLGFDVELERAPGYLGIGYVYGVDPDSGEMVPKGSTITLTII
jgi:beta-lactam-binding protein with PASTA domain